MPPHLHPRSRMTSSLFATTLAASFFVVALPHILPCPAPRVRYADSAATEADSADGTPRRRRRRARRDTEVQDGIAQFSATAAAGGGGGGRAAGDASVGGEMAATDNTEKTDTTMRRRRRVERECPVPKPRGVIGELMGFNNDPKTSISPSTPIPTLTSERLKESVKRSRDDT